MPSVLPRSHFRRPESLTTPHFDGSGALLPVSSPCNVSSASASSKEPRCLSLAVLIDADDGLLADQLARSARRNVRPIQMSNTSRGCTDVQVELVTDLLYENGLAPAAAGVIPQLTTARTSAGSSAQVSEGPPDNSAEPLAARAEERRLSLSDVPQASRSQASFPLAMAGPSIILPHLRRSLAVIVQAPRCSDQNSSTSVSHTVSFGFRRAFDCLDSPGIGSLAFRQGNVDRCCTTASLERLSRLPR